MNTAAINIIISNAAMKSFGGHMFSLACIVGVEWLDHIITLCLLIQGTARLFPKVALLLYIRMSTV